MNRKLDKQLCITGFSPAFNLSYTGYPQTGFGKKLTLSGKAQPMKWFTIKDGGSQRKMFVFMRKMVRIEWVSRNKI